MKDEPQKSNPEPSIELAPEKLTEENKVSISIRRSQNKKVENRKTVGNVANKKGNIEGDKAEEKADKKSDEKEITTAKSTGVASSEGVVKVSSSSSSNNNSTSINSTTSKKIKPARPPLSIHIYAGKEDKSKTFDPARPLTDMPEPSRRHVEQIAQIYGKKSQSTQVNTVNLNRLSKWALIQSPELAEHLELLVAGGLMKLPPSFYRNSSQQPLLSDLKTMTMLDMSDIFRAMQAFPTLAREGFAKKNGKDVDKYELDITPTIDDIVNLDNVADWEIIFYPERFDEGQGNLSTDILACSIAVHVLQQCPTRQTINEKITVEDICDYIRSYQLSQCLLVPSLREQLRHTPIYVGHVIVAAHYLGWQIEQDEKDEVHFNIGSRCGLFARYPRLGDYYINGWK